MKAKDPAVANPRTLDDIIDTFYEQQAKAGVTRPQARVYVETVFSIMARMLERGESILISNWGRLRVAHHGGYKFTSTTGDHQIADYRRVYFKLGKGLFNLMNPHLAREIHHRKKSLAE